MAMDCVILLQVSNQSISLFRGQWLDIPVLNVSSKKIFSFRDIKDNLQPIISCIISILHYGSVNHCSTDDFPCLSLVDPLIYLRTILDANVSVLENNSFFDSIYDSVKICGFFSRNLFNVGFLSHRSLLSRSFLSNRENRNFLCRLFNGGTYNFLCKAS